MPGHIFISYANQDSAPAELLLSALERRGVKCWMAPRDIPPGGSYAGAILGAIESSSCFVLIYSKNANASVHVVREVERALKFEHNIMPIRLDDSELSQSLEYLLATVQWLSLPSRPTAASVNKVADQIASSLNSPAPLPPASTAPSAAVPVRPRSAFRPWWIISFAALVSAFIIFLALQRPVRISSAPPPPPSPQVIANTPAPSSPADFIENFVKTLGSNDPTNHLPNYADRVEYYDLGTVKKDSVRRDLEHDINAWPNRAYSIHEKPKITQISPETFRAEFPMTYTLGNNKGLSSGILQMDMRFQSHDGRFQVIGIKKTTILAAKKR
jgi:hypothetical protein